MIFLIIYKGSKITVSELKDNLKEAIERYDDYEILVTMQEQKKRYTVESFSSTDKEYQVFLKPFIACSCE